MSLVVKRRGHTIRHSLFIVLCDESFPHPVCPGGKVYCCTRRKKSVAACSPDMFHPRGISVMRHMTKNGQILPTIAECDSYLCEKKC